MEEKKQRVRLNLSTKTVDEIREMYKTHTIRELEYLFNISIPMLNSIVQNNCYKDPNYTPITKKRGSRPDTERFASYAKVKEIGDSSKQQKEVLP